MPEQFYNLTEVLEKFVKEHNIAIDGLTEKQVAAAFRQAIAAGEFTRHLRVIPGRADAQAVTYIPFREVERLEARIKALEELLDDHDIPIELTEKDYH